MNRWKSFTGFNAPLCDSAQNWRRTNLFFLPVKDGKHQPTPPLPNGFSLSVWMNANLFYLLPKV